MKKSLIIRQGGALGDAVYITALPRILKEKGHDIVHVAVGKTSMTIFDNNPYIDLVYEITEGKHDEQELIDELKEQGHEYDNVFLTAGNVEAQFLHKTDGVFGPIPTLEERRETAKGVSYIDTIYQSFCLNVSGVKPEFYFSEEEENERQRILELKENENQLIVFWQLTGSGYNKTLLAGNSYIQKLVESKPNVINYVHAIHTSLNPTIPNSKDITKMWSLRESIVMASVADMVVGPESFMINVSGAFSTPKLCLFSHSAPENLISGFDNAYAMVPNCDCSPCYIIPVDFRVICAPEVRELSRSYEESCQTWNKFYPYRTMGYKCCVDFPHNDVVPKILEILEGVENGKFNQSSRSVAVESLFEGRELYAQDKYLSCAV